MGSTPISPTINSSHNKSYFEFLAYLVEHITLNYTVVGSIPTEFILLISYFYSLLINFCGGSKDGQCIGLKIRLWGFESLPPHKHNSQMNSYFAFLWKERVVGSSPTPGTILFFNARIAQMVEKNYLFIVFFMLYILLETWQSGRLHRSWKPEAVNSGPGVRIPQSPQL